MSEEDTSIVIETLNDGVDVVPEKKAEKPKRGVNSYGTVKAKGFATHRKGELTTKKSRKFNKTQSTRIKRNELKSSTSTVEVKTKKVIEPLPEDVS